MLGVLDKVYAAGVAALHGKLASVSLRLLTWRAKGLCVLSAIFFSDFRRTHSCVYSLLCLTCIQRSVWSKCQGSEVCGLNTDC